MMTHFRASPFSRALADDLFSIVKNGNVVKKKKKAILFSFFWPYFQIILKIIFCNNLTSCLKKSILIAAQLHIPGSDSTKKRI